MFLVHKGLHFSGGSNLGSFGNLGRIAAALLGALLLSASTPVSAADRESGEAWTYQMHTRLEIEEFPVDMFGNVTLEFKGRHFLAEDSVEYDVNLIGVDGELAGTAYVFGEPYVTVNAVVSGTLYEAEDGVGTVKEDIHWFLNASVGSGFTHWLTQMDSEVITVFSPPFMSEFDPYSTDSDKQWSESMMVNITVTSQENGTQVETSSSESIREFEFSMDSAIDSVTTPAGTYDAVCIIVNSENGDREELWWSDEIGNFVKTISYYAGEDEAYESMILRSYERGGSDSTLLIVAAGLAFAVAAAVLLAVVILRMKQQ